MTERHTATMTEAQMLAGIKTAARAIGFRTYHNLYAPGSDSGFPDLIVVGFGEVRAYELKGPRGRVADRQRDWIHDLNEAGIPARIVWPEDYDGVIAELGEIYERAHRAHAHQ